ncbi:MAG: SUMF1/EgtB/PvdO family nonheme iron enzyme, partial [Thermoguttaceae bacterium]|nr:SUMF1/EgtB/PvdO family nonheme iron enzyme [Thermoguttaceae bacterium]
MPIDLNSWKESADRKPGELNVLTINGVEFRMRWVPAGTFVMGGSASDHGSHNVTLTRGFWLMETEATQEMWTAIMGSNPSAFEGAKNPVDSVTWAEACEFAEKLTSLADGLTFALPTEAQWEYA